jgi:hypothetical protein
MIRIIVVLVLFFLLPVSLILVYFSFCPSSLLSLLPFPPSFLLHFLPFTTLSKQTLFRPSYPGIRSIIQIFCLSPPVQGGYKKDLLSYDVNPPLLASVCDTAWSIYSAFPAFFPLFSYRLSPLPFVCPVSASHSSSPCLSCFPPLVTFQGS